MKGMLSVVVNLTIPWSTHIFIDTWGRSKWLGCRRHFYESDVIYSVCVEKNQKKEKWLKVPRPKKKIVHVLLVKIFLKISISYHIISTRNEGNVFGLIFFVNKCSGWFLCNLSIAFPSKPSTSDLHFQTPCHEPSHETDVLHTESELSRVTSYALSLTLLIQQWPWEWPPLSVRGVFTWLLIRLQLSRNCPNQTNCLLMS